MSLTDRFRDADREWASISSKLDQAETKAANARGLLVPAWDIPIPRAQRIAEDVALDLARIAVNRYHA